MNEYDKALIIVISNQGFVDEIMETAKENGAKGGTVLHGKSTVTEEAIKFFGIKVQPEKSIILIVTKQSEKAEIMKAITAKHGVQTDARALCFSLPVSDAVGFNI